MERISFLAVTFQVLHDTKRSEVGEGSLLQWEMFKIPHWFELN